MAFRERSAWISMGATLLAYGVYFFFFGRALAEGRAFGMGGPMTLAVVAIVVLQIVLNIAAAVLSPNEARGPQDERERLIQLRASAGAFYVLQVAVIFAIASVYFADRWVMANASLAALAIAQVAQYAAVIHGYRRGV